MELEAVEPLLRPLLTLAVQERFTVDRQDQVVWDVVGKVAVWPCAALHAQVANPFHVLHVLHFLHLLDGYGSNTIRFYYLHRGETKLLMYGGSSLIFSNYNAGMRSAVGRRDIIILTPHHLVSAEYSPKYPGEENIQISSLYASLVVCVVQDIFDLFSLNSAGERKN